MKLLTYFIFALPPLYLLYLIVLYFRAHAPFVTTARHYVDEMVRVIPISNDTVLYDLGSGKGDFLFEIEKYHPKELIGYELSPLHVWYCRFKANVLHSKVHFICKDFFQADIRNATLIYLFLVKDVVDKAWIKIQKECKPGTIVCILGNTLENEKLLHEIILEPQNPKSSRMWVYQV